MPLQSRGEGEEGSRVPVAPWAGHSFSEPLFPHLKIGSQPCPERE